jgi:predicted protein tyrosine phosphatase
MKPEILIFNKKEAREFIPKNNSIIIRMGDTYPFPKLKGKYIDILELYFSDIEYNSEYSIQEEDKKKLIEFVNKYKNSVETIVIHCEYGQGRSPAIAYFISNYLEVFSIKKEDFPNINNYIIKFLEKN